MKQMRLILLIALLALLCSTGALAAEFPGAYELYEHWCSLRPDPQDSPYPDYICGVWTTDNGVTLTIAVTKDEAGEAGKAEILEQIEDDSTVQFTYQTYSHAELFAIQWELTEFLGNETGAMTIGVAEMENVVDIGIDMENPGSEAFMRECFETYGSRVRFEDMSGLTLSYTTAEDFGLLQPAGGRNPGSSTASGDSSWQLLALTSLVALFCLALWSLHLRRSAAQTEDGPIVTAAPLSRKDTEALLQNSAAAPSPEILQKVLRNIQTEKQDP